MGNEQFQDTRFDWQTALIHWKSYVVPGLIAAIATVAPQIGSILGDGRVTLPELSSLAQAYVVAFVAYQLKSPGHK